MVNIMIFRYCFIGLLVLLIIGCSNDSATSNQSSIVLDLELMQTSVNLGEEAQLDILVDECSTPIFGICLQIEFDDEILAFSNSNAMVIGDFLGDDLVTFVQEEDGIIYLTFTLTQSNEPVSGSGKLCSIYFETIDSGTSSINILTNEITIYDQNGNIIEFDSIEINNTEINII